MSLGQELSALSDSGSKRDISELELIADRLAVILADEREKSCALDYDSESSYDPSVLTEDEEFLDDTDDSCSSDDSYRPYDSDSDGSEDSDSEDSDSEDSDSEDSGSEDSDSEDSDSEDSDSEDSGSEDSGSEDSDSGDGDYNNFNNPKDLIKMDYECITEDTTCYSEPLIGGSLKISKRR
jgi:hypothetical protein